MQRQEERLDLQTRALKEDLKWKMGYSFWVHNCWNRPMGEGNNALKDGTRQSTRASVGKSRSSTRGRSISTELDLSFIGIEISVL